MKNTTNDIHLLIDYYRNYYEIPAYSDTQIKTLSDLLPEFLNTIELQLTQDISNLFCLSYLSNFISVMFSEDTGKNTSYNDVMLVSYTYLKPLLDIYNITVSKVFRHHSIDIVTIDTLDSDSYTYYDKQFILSEDALCIIENFPVVQNTSIPEKRIVLVVDSGTMNVKSKQKVNIICVD